jgi:hypothetical protein
MEAKRENVRISQEASSSRNGTLLDGVAVEPAGFSLTLAGWDRIAAVTTTAAAAPADSTRAGVLLSSSSDRYIDDENSG